MGSIYNLEKMISEIFEMARRSRLYHSQLIDLHKDYGLVHYG